MKKMDDDKLKQFKNTNPFEKAEGINIYSEMKIKSMIDAISQNLSYLETEELIRRLKDR